MRVAEYRDVYASLRDVQVSFHACVDATERAAWCVRARAAIQHGGEANCARASEVDRCRMADALRDLQSILASEARAQQARCIVEREPQQRQSRASRYNRSPGRAVRLARAARRAMRRGYF